MILFTILVFILMILIFIILRNTSSKYRKKLDKKELFSEYFRIIDLLNNDDKERLNLYLESLKPYKESGKKIKFNVHEKDVVNTTEMCVNDEGFMIISFDPKSKYYFSTYNKFTKQSTWKYAEKYDFEIMEGLIENGILRLGCNADSFIWHKNPTLSKARHIDGQSKETPFSIIFRLQYDIHYGMIRDIQKLCEKILFEKKKSTVVWRGAPTGKDFDKFKHPYFGKFRKHSRVILLEKWFDKSDEIDLGLVGNYNLSIQSDHKKYIKPKMDYNELLTYKYIISLEGADVASNLKWILASNSVVLMPRPCIESWFLESRLKPWVHFIPLEDDFGDLLDKKKWCDNNQEKCLEIIENANRYVSQFLDEKKEIVLNSIVLNTYLDIVDITVI